jgi:hypothetical protein
MPNIPQGMTFKEACALVALHQVMAQYSLTSGAEWLVEQAWQIADLMEKKR